LICRILIDYYIILDIVDARAERSERHPLVVK